MVEPLEVLDALPLHPFPPPPADYRLHVDGLVERPLDLGVDELRALAAAALTEDFTCLEGWVVPEQAWAGVPLTAVLAAAGAQPEARWVDVAAGAFVLPLALDRASEALLALQLNGAPLVPAHGAPVRLVVRGGECFTSVKWVERLTLSADPAANTAEEIARARLAPRA